MRILLISTFLLTATTIAAEKIKVVTSTTDLAWAAREIGGTNVEVQSLLKGTENPHYVDAIPEFIRLASEARVVSLVGLDLEVGWMPKVLERSGNAKVQPGGQGYCETGKAVQVLERPTGALDRSMGDIHPSGNPHFWLSPKHFAQGVQAFANTLSSVDPTNALFYQTNMKHFSDRMEKLQKNNAAKLSGVLTKNSSGPILIEYHKEFSYLLDAYGLKSLGSIEEKPGVAPSAGRLAEVALAAKTSGVKFVLAAETSPKRTVEQFSELSELPVITVPMSVSGSIQTYEDLQNQIVDKIATVLGPSRT